MLLSPELQSILRRPLTHCCRALLPMHKDLRQAGALPPLDAPHHMRAAEWGAFREGVVLRSVPGAGSLVDVGLDKVGFATVGRLGCPGLGCATALTFPWHSGV